MILLYVFSTIIASNQKISCCLRVVIHQIFYYNLVVEKYIMAFRCEQIYIKRTIYYIIYMTTYCSCSLSVAAHVVDLVVVMTR